MSVSVKKKLMTLALAVGLLGWPGADSAMAQDEESEMLETVTVIGRNIEGKLSAELADYGHQVQIIEGETIEKMGFVDISEALSALVPGMHVSSTGRGDSVRYSLNGSRDVLWLLDGVRLNSRLNGRNNVDTLGVHMIDRIEILLGGEGLFYGTNATAGVVNVISKKPTKELSGQIGASYGTGEMESVNAYVSDSIGDNQFLVFGHTESWEGYRPYSSEAYDFVGNNDRRDRGYDRQSIGFKYLREFGDGEVVDRTLSLHFQRNTAALDDFYLDKNWGLNDRTEQIFFAKWDHDLTDNFSYFVKTYYHDWWSDHTLVDLDGEFDYDETNFGYQEWGINVLSSYQFDRGDELLVGLDYQNYWAVDDVWSTNVLDTKHAEVYAVFAQLRPHFDFWPEWKMAFGARYNYIDGGNDSVVWNISSRMPIYDDKMYLRASVGTSFMLPTAIQLFLNEDGGWKGNPDLKPTESFAANVGLVTNWEMGSLELSAFMEEQTDRIGTIPYNGPDNYSEIHANILGKTKTSGYTLTGVLRPVESVSLTASYTWQEAKNPNGTKVNDTPEDFGNLSLQWNDTVSGTPMGIGLFGRYVGKVPSGLTRGGSLVDTREPPKYYGEYWVFDASIYVNITENSRIGLNLANVFDKDYGYDLSRSRRSNGPGVEDDEYHYYDSPLGNPFTATLNYTFTF